MAVVKRVFTESSNDYDYTEIIKMYQTNVD